jgi:hypothetical protein
MSKFVITYWTGTTKNVEASSIREAAKLAGYSNEYQRDYAEFHRGVMFVYSIHYDYCATIQYV